MKPLLCLFLAASLSLPLHAQAADAAAPPPSPQETLAEALGTLTDLVIPPPQAPVQTFSARLQVVRALGLPKEVAGREVTIAFQAPDHARLSLVVDGESYSLGRDGAQLWLHSAGKKFGIIGSPDEPRFRSAPDQKDGTKLPPFALPIPREQLALISLLCQVEALPAETIDGIRCVGLRVTPLPQAAALLKVSGITVSLWERETDHLPARIGYADGKGLDVAIELHDVKLSEPWAEDQWKLHAGPADEVKTVALSHLARFIPVALANLGAKSAPAPSSPKDRRLIARYGHGRLEMIDGTRVLHLKGTPEEMGEQHGRLLKKEIHEVVDRILYGVGVGSSLAKGSWFFGEIETAQQHLNPFIDERYLREADALAAAAGIEPQEARLANVFPELFHCSGFALFGAATQGGRMYHGRILDYMKGVGLEQNAVVMVMQPERGNAWVNVSYAGFIGSVTAMNEKHLSIGEMGGRGEGHWDGKPMAHLVREVMERANTIDEAVEIMRKGPRTCEYYYVISDAKTKRAVGISATPEKFETIWAGETHPRLPHAIKDTVLMSAGDRYETLAERVQKGYGKFDANSARELMTRPVCMTSNIHSVLFAPDTLDFWVANADALNVASHTRYRHYNLEDLLKPEPRTARR